MSENFVWQIRKSKLESVIFSILFDSESGLFFVNLEMNWQLALF